MTKKTTMTRVTLIILILTTWTTLATGQNLVTNPSFEDTVHCPTNPSQINDAQFWKSPTSASPDYLNACYTLGGAVGVPNNGWGNQSAHSGVAYAGLYAYNIVTNEYIQTSLTSQLTANHKYYVSFYVSLADVMQYAVSSLGAHFSSTAITSTTSNVWNLVPQIQNKSSNSLSDKNNWMLIADTLYADGTEKYITIGNFYPDSLSDTLFLGNIGGGNMAYYFIDDVSVIDFGLITNIGQNNNKRQINIYPNPTSDQSTLQFDNAKKEICTLTLYDLRGQIMRTINNITSDQVVIKKNGLPNGLYYFVLQTSDRVIVTGKLAVD